LIWVNTSPAESRLLYAYPVRPTDRGGLPGNGNSAVQLSVSSHRQTEVPNPAPTTIFIVDDDAAVRAGLDLLVRSCGWEPRTFASAEEFLHSYRREARACLLLDLQMPGIDGPTLQEIIADLDIHLPTIVVTAHKDEPMAERALAAGALAVIAKPSRNEELVRHIERALEG